MGINNKESPSSSSSLKSSPSSSTSSSTKTSQPAVQQQQQSPNVHQQQQQQTSPTLQSKSPTKQPIPPPSPGRSPASTATTAATTTATTTTTTTSSTTTATTTTTTTTTTRVGNPPLRRNVGLAVEPMDMDSEDEGSDRRKVTETMGIIEREEMLLQCRVAAAFNFPAMAAFYTSAAPSAANGRGLAASFASLCRDPHPLVRRTVAAGFHEVVRLLGPTKAFPLQSELTTLLRDDSIEVVQGIVKNLNETLTNMAQLSSFSFASPGGSDLTSALLQCEAHVANSNNWRLHADIFKNWTALSEFVSSDQIYFKFVPFLFRKVKESRPLPVRLAAARSLLVLIRNNRKLEQRLELCHKLVDDFCLGRSCHSRSLFVDICRLVLDIFSRQFFKDNFFVPLLELAGDPVANVRLKFCKLVPDLKSALRLPQDEQLLQNLEAATKKLLINDDDRDVAEMMATERKRMNAAPSSSSTERATDDLCDARKLEQERDIIESEERLKREEEMKSLRLGGSGGPDAAKAGGQKKKELGGSVSAPLSSAGKTAGKKGGRNGRATSKSVGSSGAASPHGAGSTPPTTASLAPYNLSSIGTVNKKANQVTPNKQSSPSLPPGGPTGKSSGMPKSSSVDAINATRKSNPAGAIGTALGKRSSPNLSSAKEKNQTNGSPSSKMSPTQK